MTESEGTYDGPSFAEAEETPDEEENAPEPNAGAHPIIAPETSTGQAAVPAPDTNAEAQIEETE